MSKKILIALLFSFSLFAQNQQNMEQYAREIYQKTGLGNRVPFEHFQAGYYRYLEGKRNGEFRKPVITFVNFNIHNGQKRLFLTDVSGSGAGLVFESYVGHGVNSDSGGNSVDFGNVPESKKSSLGFFKVAEDYTGKYGYSLRVDGLSDQLNGNARSRAIVFHPSHYSTLKVIESMGRMGNSWGCFTIPYAYRDSLFAAIKNGTLLYAFHSSMDTPRISAEGLVEVAMADNSPSGLSVTPGDELPTLSDMYEYEGNSSLMAQGLAGDHMGLSPGEGIDGMNSIDYDGDGEPDGFDPLNPNAEQNGDAPYHGSKDFEACQSYANKKWDQVAGSNPSDTYKGSWPDLESKISRSENIHFSAAQAAGENHLGKVRECAAVSYVADPSNFELDNPNQQQTYKSADGKIECQYLNAEVVDYSSCKNLVDTHNKFLKEEQQMYANQKDSYQASGEKQVAGLQDNINIQGNSALVASALTAEAKGIAAEREAFQKARIEAMTTAVAAMPTYRSLLQKCNEKHQQNPDVGVADYANFTKTIPDLKLSVPSLKNPCPAALGRLNISYLQNRKAKEQAMKVIEELGGKVTTLQGQQETLGKRSKEMGSVGNANGVDYDNMKLKALNEVNAAENDESELQKLKGSSDTSYNTAYKTYRAPTSLNTNFASGRRKEIYSDSGFNSNAYLSQLKNNSFKFFKSAAKDKPQKVLKFMKSYGLSLDDIEFAYRAGKISKERRDFLMAKLKGRVGTSNRERQVDFPSLRSTKKGKSDYQIEKNKGRDLFEIISHRYLKQNHLFSSY